MAVDIHGKSYKMVAERVNEIHAKHKDRISITTEIVNDNWLDEGTVVIKATILLMAEDRHFDCVYTGHAYEKLGATPINSTSALENCETSAIGRALASAGFAGSEFASADELVNALEQQKNLKTTGRKSDGAQSSRAVPTDGAQKSAGKLIGRWDSFEDKVGFGKHKDSRWIDVPQDYLIWVVDKATKVPVGAIEMAKGTLDLLESKVADPTTDPFPEDSANNSEETPIELADKLAKKFDAKQQITDDLPF